MCLYLQLVYQYVFANTKIDTYFKLYTVSIPRQEILADKKSLSEYGIFAPCLLLVEMTEECTFDEDKWTSEMVSECH